MNNQEYIDEQNEVAYMQGRQAAWLDVLRTAMRGIGEPNDAAQARIQLEEVRIAIALLYEVVVGKKLSPSAYLPDAVRAIEKRWPEE